MFRENRQITKKSYEPSRHVMDFHLAGFAYYDGIEIINELVLGTLVDLVGEPDNPYDPEAVAIYYKNRKIGYVPRDKNGLMSKLLYFGHHDLFDARVQLVNKEQHIDRQIRIVIRIKDKR